jgi:hypothetical protein
MMRACCDHSMTLLYARCTVQGVSFHELFKSLFDAINGDKTGRQQLYGILLRLFFYEELPPDLIQQLVPLLQASLCAAAACATAAVSSLCCEQLEGLWQHWRSPAVAFVGQAGACSSPGRSEALGT